MSDELEGIVRWGVFKWVIGGLATLFLVVGGGMYHTATASISDVEQKVEQQGLIQSAQTAQIARMQKDIDEIKRDVKEGNQTNKLIDDKLDKLLEQDKHR